MNTYNARLYIFSLALALVILKGTKCYMYVFLQEPGAAFCVDDSGVRYKPGDVWYDDEKCEKLRCSGAEASLKIIGAGCGIIHVVGCETVRGSGHYPNCCPRPKC
uniref:Toxin-like protein 14 n=1 Tax=Urodacus yaschenkoi TaxID=1273102 RepID=TXUE_UROYA|nr:RecName: Full=Toxin-like protein 14; Flags: Precursor [Urodacus yaschenkoi]AGA82764.1 toxin-like protein 14 precursor [Urodacus yaschenkoi]